jgi:hypothetical protein
MSFREHSEASSGFLKQSRYHGMNDIDGDELTEGKTESTTFFRDEIAKLETAMGASWRSVPHLASVFYEEPK